MKLTLSELRRLAREKGCKLTEKGANLAAAPKPKKVKTKKPRLPDRPIWTGPPAVLPWSLTISAPIKIVSTANFREHWSAKYRWNKQHAKQVQLAFFGMASKIPPSETGLKITLTRIGGKPMDRADNLPNGFKAVIDQVAQQIGVDDGSPYLSWHFEQRPGKVAGVEIRIEPR
jgi:hypothetical protein